MSFNSVLCFCFAIVAFCPVYNSQNVKPRVIRKSELACQRYQHLRENFQMENQTCAGPLKTFGGYTGFNEFPHMVAIGFDVKKGSGYKFLCDGSLISEKFVLTSAYCLKRRRQGPKIVRLGKVKIKRNILLTNRLSKDYFSDNTSEQQRLQRSY